MNNPIICYRNSLEGSVVTMIAGEDALGSPMTNIYNGFPSKPALPISDANGDLIVEFSNFSTGISMGEAGFGNGPWGGYDSSQVIIFGASRYQTAGARFPVGTQVKIEAFQGVWVEIYNKSTIYPDNKSFLSFASVEVVATKYRLSITGLAADSTVSIPEIFIGSALVMPFLNLGYDPYHEKVGGNKFTAESGQLYQSLKFRRMELSPSWSYLDDVQASKVDRFRELTLENLGKFWFAWSPESNPHEVYLMQHTGETASMPYRSGGFRDFKSLKLVEVL